MGKTTLIWLKFYLLMLIGDGDKIPESKEKGDGVLSFVRKLRIGSLNAVQLINNSEQSSIKITSVDGIDKHQ